MKHLIVVRHAKSDWNLPVSDKERTITSDGMSAIAKIANLSKTFVTDDFTIWSSTATRAKQTAAIFCNALQRNTEEIHFIENLYTFDALELEKEIRKCNNAIEKLILFGHNEAITNFVNKFGNISIFNVPTAGFVYLQFDMDSWQQLKKGKTIQKLFPKEI